MTRILIVSRTRMAAGVCIGALERESMKNIRLCAENGRHDQPVESPYQVGEVWEVRYSAPQRSSRHTSKMFSFMNGNV